jgi:hypothetical protein
MIARRSWQRSRHGGVCDRSTSTHRQRSTIKSFDPRRRLVLATPILLSGCLWEDTQCLLIAFTAAASSAVTMMGSPHLAQIIVPPSWI